MFCGFGVRSEQKGTGMNLIRRLDTKENRQFWKNLEKAVAAAKKEWPARLKKEVRDWYRKH